jgi:hypothetical protein
MLTDRLNFYVDILQDILNDLELNDIWGFLSTQTALAVYVIVLLASVLFLTVCVLVSAHSSPRVVSVVGAGVEAEEEQPPKNETKRQRKKREKAEKKAAKQAAKEARKEEKRRRKRGYTEETESPTEEQTAQTEQGAPEGAAPEAGVDAAPEGDRTGATPRFEELTRIDRRMADYHTPSFNDYIGLEELCTRFRNYAAYKLHLYYSIDDIRRFMASLGVSPIIIMQGMSGTGKTSLASAFGHFVEHDSTIIPIQPMWKERSDMIGYFNEFTERFNEMTLLKNLYEANYNREIYVTVLDEMNIARVEYYFADFLSLLELPDKKDRMLEVVSDTWAQDPKLFQGGRLQLPVNMWYIGTANNDDSTFAISDKVYDRAMIINLDKKAKPFIAQATAPVHISIEYWNQLVANAKETYARNNLRSNAKGVARIKLQQGKISYHSGKSCTEAYKNMGAHTCGTSLLASLKADSTTEYHSKDQSYCYRNEVKISKISNYFVNNFHCIFLSLEYMQKRLHSIYNNILS